MSAKSVIWCVIKKFILWRQQNLVFQSLWLVRTGYRSARGVWSCLSCSCLFRQVPCRFCLSRCWWIVPGVLVITAVMEGRSGERMSGWWSMEASPLQNHMEPIWEWWDKSRITCGGCCRGVPCLRQTQTCSLYMRWQLLHFRSYIEETVHLNIKSRKCIYINGQEAD